MSAFYERRSIKMMKFLYKKHKLLGNKGFSLVELIIVIAIMAVLMAVLAPQLIKYVEKSRVQADDSAASEILNAVKIALNDDSIYDAITGDETVTWNGGTGAIATTALHTAITLPDGTGTFLDTYLLGEVTSTVGVTIDTKSKTREDMTYTVNIDLDANNIPTATITNDGWTDTPAP
jgi:prepilin-type N-terminal cleavage/methylation domain-containing protein